MEKYLGADDVDDAAVVVVDVAAVVVDVVDVAVVVVDVVDVVDGVRGWLLCGSGGGGGGGTFGVVFLGVSRGVGEWNGEILGSGRGGSRVFSGRGVVGPEW